MAVRNYKTTKDFAAAKSKDKNRVSVKSQKQEGGYMCIVETTRRKGPMLDQFVRTGAYGKNSL